MNTATIHACFPPHDDPDASAALYGDKLGSELCRYAGSGGISGTAVGASGRPGTYIASEPPAAEPCLTGLSLTTT
jgi:hypothetical protein